MEETDTLYCKAGEHEWERPKKRGMKPANCPEHTEQKKTITREEHQKRLREGRERARKERDAEGIERVLNWRENWLKPESSLHQRYAEGDLDRDEFVRGLRELSSVPFPTDKDWDAAARAGLTHGGIPEDESNQEEN